jgi:predicted extracellular nuclease
VGFSRSAAALLAVLASLVWTGSALASASGVVISEFRFRGPAGGNDEFVELMNTATTPVDISGWRLQGCAGASGAPSARATVPDGITLGAGQHYLFTNTSGTLTGDTGYGTGIADDGGARITLADGTTVVDGVGSSSGAVDACREGAGLSIPTANGDNGFERRTGGRQDTDDNAADFLGPKASNPQAFGTAPEPPFLTIGEVQGSVGPADDGTLHRSPYAPPSGNGSGQAVIVRGVIYEETRNGNNRGFFIQNTAAQADGDPFSSDGIFAFVGGFDTLLGGYNPTVGDEIVLSGNVSEFFNFTQLSSPRLVEVVSSFNDVDALLPAAETNPPNLLADANRYWERQEGMRMRVPAGARVTDGLDVFSGPDSEMWVMRGDNPLASRTDPYAQRAFRDPHPLDNDASQLFDDGNGYRILVGAFGVKGAVNNPTINLSPARTFDTVTNDLVGGVYFNFGKYAVMTVNQPTLTNGVDPSLNAPPTAPDRAIEYSVGDYNVENLYDFRDDPFDGCDFAGNAGCPGVRPPFDYVPASDAVYQERLGLIAEQITGDLHAPDIILVQEAEDQDICAVVGGALDCDDGVNNRDGKPDTLQELALRIAASGGPAYDAAFDRDGSDDRGIVAALMYRTDRVELLPATAGHPVLGSSPQIDYRVPGNAYNSDVQNPKALNAPLPADVDTSSGVDGNEVYTRDPQVGWFRIWRNGVGDGVFFDVYAISNHFSSTPDARRGQRKEQSLFLAEIVQATGGERVVAGGDFNVFPRPDDPVLPPSDQLGPLYDIGLWNVWDTMVAENASAAYSYVFVGQAQTLDGQFITPTLHDELAQTRVAHVNADFPADFAGDGPRGLSDHDPMASRFELLTIDALQALLDYYDAAGEIRGGQTAAILRERLARAERFLDEGRLAAYRDQLQAFADQVQDFAPEWIDQDVADALAGEADALRELSS